MICAFTLLLMDLHDCPLFRGILKGDASHRQKLPLYSNLPSCAFFSRKSPNSENSQRVLTYHTPPSKGVALTDGADLAGEKSMLVPWQESAWSNAHHAQSLHYRRIQYGLQYRCFRHRSRHRRNATLRAGHEHTLTYYLDPHQRLACSLAPSEDGARVAYRRLQLPLQLQFFRQTLCSWRK